MENGIFVSLTNDPLNPTQILDLVRSPSCGAVAGKSVLHLDYDAFPPLALPSLHSISSGKSVYWRGEYLDCVK